MIAEIGKEILRAYLLAEADSIWGRDHAVVVSIEDGEWDDDEPV